MDYSLRKFINVKRATKDMINIDPLQTGGILTPEARQALLEWGDGFSICDYCQGKMTEIKSPPIYDFVHDALPQFVGADVVSLTQGARESIFTIMHTISQPGDFVIIDKNAHYSTYIAAEKSRLVIREVKNSGYPEYKIDEDAYEEVINDVQSKNGNIALLMITWPDGNYGNVPDGKKIVEISKKFSIPLLINAAYAIGRMPIKLNDIGADFIVGSGHKSMASSGPIGLIGMKKQWEEKILKKSKFFIKKEVELLGCATRGVAIMTLMASFPKIVERVLEWPEQVTKAQWFSDELEKLGIKQLGEKPHRHDLMFFESDTLFEISQKDKRGRYFLYKELQKRGIWGIKPGLTKNFKLSTFAASKEELKNVINGFSDILRNSS